MRSLRLGEPVDLALERGEPAGDAGGVVLVVPQVGGGDLLAEVGDLLAHRVEVEHLLDGAHGRLELLDLGVVVGSCHKVQGYCAPRRTDSCAVAVHTPHAGVVIGPTPQAGLVRRSS